MSITAERIYIKKNYLLLVLFSLFTFILLNYLSNVIYRYFFLYEMYDLYLMAQ